MDQLFYLFRLFVLKRVKVKNDLLFQIIVFGETQLVLDEPSDDFGLFLGDDG